MTNNDECGQRPPPAQKDYFPKSSFVARLAGQRKRAKPLPLAPRGAAKRRHWTGGQPESKFLVRSRASVDNGEVLITLAGDVEGRDVR